MASIKDSTIEERKEICEACPIFDEKKKRCNPNLYVNPITDEVSDTYRVGYVKGCGCNLMFKWKSLLASCPAGKW